MPRTLPAYFQALPAYLGGKRRLARTMFSVLQEVLPAQHWSTCRLLDPFCGSCGVALFAKARGFDVCASDLALRAVVPARALIANSSTRLSFADVLDLFVTEPEGAGVAAAHAPKIFSPEQAALLDNAIARAQRRAEPIRSLLLLLLIKFTLRLQPMSMLRARDAATAAAGDFDRVGPHRVAHYLRVAPLLTPRGLWGLAQDVNSGVFGGRGEALLGDARDVLRSQPADITVLDPPYPSRTGYTEYRVLDALLGANVPPGPPPGIDELLDAASEHPLVMLCYGGASVTLSDLTAVVARHRPVLRALALPYSHLGAIAWRRRTREYYEFLIIAGR